MTRARQPDETGYEERDGVRVHWERHGEGEPALFLLPTWTIIHSRFWKGQIPYFADRQTVITFDGRGNGRSDRPLDPAAYRDEEFVADALAVMDAASVERAVTVSLSKATVWNLMLATAEPARIAGAVFLGPLFPVAPFPDFMHLPFDEELPPDLDGYAFNRSLWLRDFPGFVDWYARMNLPEPHSSKQLEDYAEWALATTPETMVATWSEPMAGAGSLADAFSGLIDLIRPLAQQVRCQSLVICGENDLLCPPHYAQALADETGGRLILMQDTGHVACCRKPVAVNLAVRDFVEEVAGLSPRDPNVHRSRDGGRLRALFVSSPIGLGHAQRDVAIAREMRALVPGLQIDWLAQDPVTRVLEAEGEHIHPASRRLANESTHLESESGDHDLHVFHAYRRMDEILVANFMVFHDVVESECYDLWIADEGWEIDHFLHEHPDLKRAPFAWLTDFVGWLPMDDADERERYLCADYNDEMVEHVREHPQVRDCALFIGEPDDIVGERLGPQLPPIREWAEQHFDFVGYVSGYDPEDLPDRDVLRSALGYRDDEQVCIVSAGGSGVGDALLRKAIAAYPEARERVPDLRMVLIAGPRIDRSSLPGEHGLEVLPYVHNLYRQLAVCDLALSHGGLSTTMELTAAKRPFLYFPLKHHCEQSIHVRHRLERYGAGRRMDFDRATPDAIAAAIAMEIGREPEYRRVDTGGARRAAERIAELL